jgi:acyl-CoA dehydrogenase
MSRAGDDAVGVPPSRGAARGKGTTPMTQYDLEAVDRLPFSTPEKSERYRTENYRGAVGLNWYETDPSLQLTMAYYLQPDELAVAEPHLRRIGELMGGPVARWAEQTDRNPARLERYDRWGHDISQVVQPTSFTESKRAVLDAQKALKGDARRAGVNPSLPFYAANYLLNQADIGMGCALGTGGGMVKSLVAAYAPADVRDHVLAKFETGEWEGETAQLLTERAGGSDLGALETTATRHGDGCTWLLNGFKWFASNCDGQVFVVLAKPEGAPDSGRGVASFLVLRTRRDGSRNGIRIRRLKDKLGTRSVASGEVEFVDAEAFLLSGEPSGEAVEAGPSDGKGLGRMMELTNAARLGIALFAVGNARRALVESLCYARQRRAFGDALLDKPLVRRKLAEMIVDVEAAQAMVFDGTGFANHRQPRAVRQRIAVPVTKLKVCRLGITMASDAIELHGGNGYIETWPVARLLRDAQVNTIWEGPDNILCLDVRRGIERAHAHQPLLERLHDAVTVSDDDETTRVIRCRVDDLEAAITAWSKLDGAVAEARLFPLTRFIGDVYAGALLIEQAAWERATRQTDRKALVARLYALRHLSDQGRLRGIDVETDEAIERFDDLIEGALVVG